MTQRELLRTDAECIYTAAVRACLPDEAVKKALDSLPEGKGKLILLAIGKAAWQMAQAATRILGDRLHCGMVITKYGHSKGAIPGVEIYEAGHPVPDENTVRATERALEMTGELSSDDIVLFLVSGGGSALFESVDCDLSELKALNADLLASGASIEEINVVRKHLSNIKGGRFAIHCAPAQVFTVLLSDVLGDRLDTIASGPSVADPSTVEQVQAILQKYQIFCSQTVKTLLLRETPKNVENATYFIGGSVRELCRHAAEEARARGYETHLLTDHLTCEASQAGSFLASVARTHRESALPLAFVAGGETVVHLKGKGLGGRNQELALAAAKEIDGFDNVALFSIGSDGTDGPTDAAGGYVDGFTASALRERGIDIFEVLEQNDSYHALAACGGLVFLGATGTNVNDLAVVLIQPNY